MSSDTGESQSPQWQAVGGDRHPPPPPPVPRARQRRCAGAGGSHRRPPAGRPLQPRQLAGCRHAAARDRPRRQRQPHTRRGRPVPDGQQGRGEPAPLHSLAQREPSGRARGGGYLAPEHPPYGQADVVPTDAQRRPRGTAWWMEADCRRTPRRIYLIGASVTPRCPPLSLAVPVWPPTPRRSWRTCTPGGPRHAAAKDNRRRGRPPSTDHPSCTTITTHDGAAGRGREPQTTELLTRTRAAPSASFGQNKQRTPGTLGKTPFSPPHPRHHRGVDVMGPTGAVGPPHRGAPLWWRPSPTAHPALWLAFGGRAVGAGIVQAGSGCWRVPVGQPRPMRSCGQIPGGTARRSRRAIVVAPKSGD